MLHLILKDNHPRAMFSLTRVVGDRLTCSCAFPQAFHHHDVVRNEFCNLLPVKSSKDVEVNHYHINCVSDLDEDGGPIDVSVYTISWSLTLLYFSTIIQFNHFQYSNLISLKEWKQKLYNN